MLVPFALALTLALPVDGEAPPHDPTRFAVNVVMNGGFELATDSTTSPPKYGAYWRDAFVPQPGDPTDRIVEYAEGRRGLLLEDKAKPVQQIVTLYGPHARDFEVTLRVRFRGLDAFASPTATGSADTARLVVGAVTQYGREVTAIRYRVGGAETDDAPLEQPVVIPTVGEPDAEGFHLVRLHVGRDVEALTGAPPEPWNKLYLSANGGTVLVDDVVGVHHIPRVAPRELREFLLEDIRDLLAVHLGRPGKEVAGLGLVDPRTGYQTIERYDVETGQIGQPTPIGCLRGVHDLMLRYLRIGDMHEDHAMLRHLVRSRLFSFLKSMLRWNVYEPTGLYCQFNMRTRQPDLSAALVPQSFIAFVLAATELPLSEFEGKRSEAITASVRMADALVKLHRQHDLPTSGPKAAPFGRGPNGNWFGRLPEKFFPDGSLTEPLARPGKYDQAWAVKGDRSWYHDFDSAEALAWVYGVAPKPEYAKSIDRVIAKFDRQWDAERYDMENDTDDHYGMNVEALLRGYRASGYALPQMRDKAQEFTDYRLPRELVVPGADGEPTRREPVAWDDNLWVQGIRLGSFTTGDQPRAYRGPIWLHNTPAEHNPETSGFEAYRNVLAELAKVDLKRRLMDDGLYTDASSWQWEQISACFRGDYIGPCSQGKDWEGDMGDLFAGPSANAFRCLGRTLEVLRRGPNREFLSWYYLVAAHTMEEYRRQYGYRFGMSKETARRYQLRDHDPIQWSTVEYYSFATVIVHAETLDSVDLQYDEASVRIAGVARSADGQGVEVRLTGTPGRTVTVHAAPETVFSNLAVTDWRLRHVDPRGAATRTADAELGPDGGAVVVLPLSPEATQVAVDAVLPTLDGEDVDDLASGEYSL